MFNKKSPGSVQPCHSIWPCHLFQVTSLSLLWWTWKLESFEKCFICAACSMWLQHSQYMFKSKTDQLKRGMQSIICFWCRGFALLGLPLGGLAVDLTGGLFTLSPQFLFITFLICSLITSILSNPGFTSSAFILAGLLLLSSSLLHLLSWLLLVRRRIPIQSPDHQSRFSVQLLDSGPWTQVSVSAYSALYTTTLWSPTAQSCFLGALFIMKKPSLIDD